MDNSLLGAQASNEMLIYDNMLHSWVVMEENRQEAERLAFLDQNADCEEKLHRTRMGPGGVVACNTVLFRYFL
ncbi:hypothetical protein EMCRGX_G026326 [Ephydatia muelleri]